MPAEIPQDIMQEMNNQINSVTNRIKLIQQRADEMDKKIDKRNINWKKNIEQFNYELELISKNLTNLKKEFSQCRFSYHDPIVKSFLGNIPVSSIDECVKDSNVVLFLTNHPSLMNIEVNQILERTARPLLVVDCWHNISNPAEISQQRDVEIVRIGDGSV